MAPRPLAIKLVAENADVVTRALTAFGAEGKAALDKITAAATPTGRALDNLKRSLDPVYDSQVRVAQQTGVLDRALKAGSVTAEEHGRLVGLLQQRYATAATGAATLTAATVQTTNAFALNRNGMLQLQAAGVNAFQALASGMSVTRVATMEGAQAIGAFVQGGLSLRALLNPLGIGLGVAAAAAAAAGAAFVLLRDKTIDAAEAQKALQDAMDKSNDLLETQAQKAERLANATKLAALDSLQTASAQQAALAAQIQREIRDTQGVVAQRGVSAAPGDGGMTPAELAAVEERVTKLRRDLSDVQAQMQTADAQHDRILGLGGTDPNALNDLVLKYDDAAKKASEFWKVQAALNQAVDDGAISQTRADAVLKGAINNIWKPAVQAKQEQTSALADYIQKLSDALAVQQQELGDRAEVKAVIEAQAKAQEDYNKGLRDTPLLRAAEVEEVRKLSGALDDAQKAEADRKKAAADADRATAQKAQEFQRQFEHAVENATDQGAQVFYDAFSGQISSIGDLLKETILRALAQAASEAIVRPFASQIIGSVIGFPGGAGGSSAGGLLSSGGGFSLSNGLSLASLGNSLSSGFSGLSASLGSSQGLIGGINSLGASTGIFGGTMSAAPSASFIGPMPATQGLLGTTTLAQFAGGVGLGFGAGSLVGGFIAGDSPQRQQNATIGAGGGALAGAAIGSIIPGVGTIIGGLIGGLIGGGGGGLIGPKKSVGPGGGAILRLDPTTGRLIAGSVSGDNGQDLDSLKQLQSGTQSDFEKIAALAGITGVSGVGADTPSFELNSFASGGGLSARQFLPQGGDPRVLGTFGDNATAASASLIRNILSQFSFTGVNDSVAQVLKNGSPDLDKLTQQISLAQTYDQVVNFKAITTTAQDQLAAVAKQIDDFNKALADAGTSLTAVGLDAGKFNAGITRMFDANVDQMIQAIENPFQSALDQLDAQAKANVDLAKSLGANVDNVVKLNQLQRDAAFAQFANPARQAVATAGSSIVDFLNGQAVSDTSSLSPTARLTEAQRQFGDLLAQVRGGDVGAVGGLTQSASTLLGIGRTNFASSVDFANLEAMVRSSLASVGQTITSPDFVADQITRAIAQQTAAQSGDAAVTQKQLDGLRTELQLIRQQLAVNG